MQAESRDRRPEQNRNRTDDGRYDYESMDIMCVCGHTLGRHFAGVPRACAVGEAEEPDNGSPMADANGKCRCKRFKRAKANPLASWRRVAD